MLTRAITREIKYPIVRIFSQKVSDFYHSDEFSKNKISALFLQIALFARAMLTSFFFFFLFFKFNSANSVTVSRRFRLAIQAEVRVVYYPENFPQQSCN